jgi:hypothetical protein
MQKDKFSFVKFTFHESKSKQTCLGCLSLNFIS